MPSSAACLQGQLPGLLGEEAVTIHERIWKMAQAAFGKDVFKLWVRIEAEADHSIWLWNDKYGPLTFSQREYAADIICRALARAREVGETGHKIALYKTLLRTAKNHENIDLGFKARKDSDGPDNLDGIFEGIGV